MHFLEDIHTLKHAYSPTGDLEQSCLVFFNPPIFFPLFHPDQFDSLFLFLFTHFSVRTHRRAVEMHRPLFYSSSWSHTCAGHPRVAGVQRKRICKHSCLSNRCLHARTHTHTHRHMHAYTAVKSKPITSHLFLTSSQSDQRLTVGQGGSGSASLWPFSHTCGGTQTLFNLGSCRFFLPPTLILLPCLLTPSIFIIPLSPSFFDKLMLP